MQDGDGVTLHRTVKLFQALFSVYDNRYMEWPPYSSDLNPCDFFLWGFIEDKYYLKYPKAIEDFKDAIRSAVRSIDKATIQRIYTSFKRSIEFCSKSNGGHFEGIVFNLPTVICIMKKQQFFTSHRIDVISIIIFVTSCGTPCIIIEEFYIEELKH